MPKQEDDLTLSSTEIINSWKDSIANILTVNVKLIWTGQSLPGYIENMCISQEWYLQLTKNSSCITRLLAKVMGPLQWMLYHKIFKKDTYGERKYVLKKELVAAAWQLIVITSQKAFPVIPHAGQEMVEKGGIITVHLELDSKAAMIAHVMCRPLATMRDSK